MISPNTLLLNRYLVLHKIGEGGQGAVYEAVDQRLNQKIALKQTMSNNPELMRAFEREARILAQLNHPALPHLSDYFRDGESQFLVMQYIPGDDLARLLRKQGSPFEVELVVKWGEQLLDALDYLHSHKPPIIHGDIKPANLKLSSRGQLILLDFGMSKGGLTGQTVRIRGKSIYAHYAPLEQMNRQGTTEQSDLYSLAATLYYLLTATELPTAATRAGAQITQNADPLLLANQVNPQVPIPLANLLTQAMSLNPAERPPSAAAMRIALQQATGSSGRRGVTPPNAHLPPRQSENKPQSAAARGCWLTALGILALLAAVSLFLFILERRFVVRDSRNSLNSWSKSSSERRLVVKEQQ
jgi:serine/threonine protein kinase